MASSSTTFLCLLLILGLASPSMAADIIVGGDLQGWNLGVDMNAWASTQDLKVGDTLHFEYVPLVHNVVQLNAESSLVNCITNQPLSIDGSGHTSLALDQPGDYFFTSSIATDCLLGLKLKVTVDDA